MLYIGRVLFASLWFAFSCFVGIFVGIIRPFDPRNSRVTTKLIDLSHKFVGLKIELRNKEILDVARPCVFISNHQDNLDIFPGSHTLPKQTVTVGKKSLIYFPFFGQFFWLSGNILIDRKNKKSAFQTMDVVAEAIKEKKLSVWIMPEGTRSRGRGLLPFKKGPFITAIKAQVSIVPIAISTYTHIHLGKWKAGTILIEVLSPISTTGLKIEDATQLKDDTFILMQKTISKLDKEIEQSKVKNYE